jgi:hypothetical protein
MSPKKRFVFTSRAFAFSADIILALVLVIGVMVFMSDFNPQSTDLEERRITDQYVDDLFVALDHSGYVSQEVDTNGFSSVTLQNIYDKATLLLPNSYDLLLTMKSYPVDINSCRDNAIFSSCFPDANVQSLTVGTSLPPSAPFIHGRRVFLKQQPASQCTGALSGPGNPSPFSLFSNLPSADFQSTDLNIEFDVNVSPSGPWTCDQNITVTLSVTSNTGARKAVDMMLVFDRSGSMSYDYLLNTTDAQALDLDGDYVYLADSTSGLRDINAVDPGLTNIVGTYNSPGTARDVDVSGGYAFLADGTSGLRVVNVTTPSSPASVAQLAIGGDAYGVASNGNATYVVTSGSDVTDISNTGTGNNELIIGRSASQLYGAQSFQPAVAQISGVGVTLRDVGSPSGNITVSIRSTLTGSDLVSTTIPSSSINGSYQTLTATFPTVLGVTPGSTYYLVLTTSATSSSNYYEWRGSNSSSYGSGQAYQNTSSQNWDARFITYFINGLIKIDTTIKSAPFVLGAHTLTDPWRVNLAGTTAYVSDGSAGMKIFNVSGNTPSLTGTYNSTGTVYDTIVSGNYAFVSDGTSGLRVVNITTPSSPSLSTTYNTPGTAYASRLNGNYIYVADGSTIQVLDVSTPTSPVFVNSYSTPWNYRDLEVRMVGGILWGYLAIDSSLEGLATVNLDTGPKIDQAQVAATSFVDFNGWDSDNDQMGIVSYSSSATTDQTLTLNYSLIKIDINATVATGGTATGDGINAASAELNSVRHNPSALKFQILMSDGQTNAGANSSTAAITANNNGIIIYTIGFGKDADSDELSNIATITGGKYYAAGDQDTLIDVYSLIAQDIQLIATDANIVAGLEDGITLVSDGNGLLLDGNIQFDINTQEVPPWIASYTFNIPCTATLACSSTLFSVPSPGTHFEYIDVNGVSQEEVWDVFSTQGFNYQDLNISIVSGNLVGSENTDLTVLVQSLGNVDTNASSVSFYEGAPPTNLLSTVSIPPLCGQLNAGCINYSYEFTHNVPAEGELYAVVNPDGGIPECTYNDQDVIFCYYAPATQFFTLDYWAWQRG